MARPKKEKSYEKTNRVTVRFTDAEMKEIQEKSGKLNMSVSEYIRERVNRGKVEYRFDKNRALDDVMPLTEEFHKIGINLNQIAHHLNGGGELTDSIKRDLIKRAEDLRLLTEKVIDLTED